jgi:hypothetical protein
MIFTAQAVTSISKALSMWEYGEYISCALVAVACAGEYIADFTNWVTGGIRESKERLAKLSTLLLIFALALELLCLVRANTLSSALIGSLDQKAGEANEKAKAAIGSSAIALAQSGAAEQSSGKALADSDKARASASNALALATSARQEADSFEKDIASAKRQATEAESHLAEALKRAADATAELNRLKSPRSLVNIPGLITTLQVFKGTEYTFSSVFQDEESIDLLKAIDSALQGAGWKRVKPPGGFAAVNVYGRQVDFAVPVNVITGMQVSVDSEQPLAVLQSLRLDELPQPVRAAVALNLSLSSNISPPQEKSEGKPVDVEPGTSGTIRIAVGKKP